MIGLEHRGYRGVVIELGDDDYQVAIEGMPEIKSKAFLSKGLAPFKFADLVDQHIASISTAAKTDRSERAIDIAVRRSFTSDVDSTFEAIKAAATEVAAGAYSVAASVPGARISSNGPTIREGIAKIAGRYLVRSRINGLLSAVSLLESEKDELRNLQKAALSSGNEHGGLALGNKAQAYAEAIVEINDQISDLERIQRRFESL